jgi:hypothetical protein
VVTTHKSVTQVEMGTRSTMPSVGTTAAMASATWARRAVGMGRLGQDGMGLTRVLAE